VGSPSTSNLVTRGLGGGNTNGGASSCSRRFGGHSTQRQRWERYMDLELGLGKKGGLRGKKRGLLVKKIKVYPPRIRERRIERSLVSRSGEDSCC